MTGPFLFAGYAKRLEMTRELFDGGWFDTGDIAHIDADGYLKISGRTKDVIIRGGENIPVAYVENALYENPKIAAVAVVGIPDPRLQERACACVVLRARGRGVHLHRDAAVPRRKGLARQYWPERLEVMAEHCPRPPAARSRSSGSATRSRVRHDGSTGTAAYLVAGVRTPFGRYGGALAAVRPDDLAAHVLRELWPIGCRRSTGTSWTTC